VVSVSSKKFLTGIIAKSLAGVSIHEAECAPVQVSGDMLMVFMLAALACDVQRFCASAGLPRKFSESRIVP
jgi:hypothetical protein